MTSRFLFGGKFRNIYQCHFDRKRCRNSPLYSDNIKILVGLSFRSSYSYAGIRSIERTHGVRNLTDLENLKLSMGK